MEDERAGEKRFLAERFGDVRVVTIAERGTGDRCAGLVSETAIRVKMGRDRSPPERRVDRTMGTQDEAGFEPPLPPYAFVPGGPWPHPTGSDLGHSAGRTH